MDERLSFHVSRLTFDSERLTIKINTIKFVKKHHPNMFFNYPKEEYNEKNSSLSNFISKFNFCNKIF